MKSTKIIIISLFCVSLFFIYQCNSKVKTTNSISIQLFDQSDSTQYFSYKIDFPGMLHYANLAKAIKSYATVSRDSFFSIMPRDPASLRFPWQLIVNFNKALESPRFVGYLAEYYRFTGGAHGVSATKTFVYDKKKEKLIELKDLFNDSTALNAISHYARNAVAQNIYGVESMQDLNSSNQDWVKTGTVPAFSNFETFLPTGLTDKGLTELKIIFSPYQVAPHSAGMPTVIIPAKQFYRYLAPEYKKVFIKERL